MNEIKKKRYLDCKYLDAGMDGMLCSMDMCTTCKEFNGETCSYFMSKNEVEQKEIEELSEDLTRAVQYDIENADLINSYDTAINLIKQGYHNCKDKVVLDKEEYERLLACEHNLNVGRESYRRMEERAYSTIESLKEELAQARKETAREIYLQAIAIVNATKHIIQGREYLHIDALKEIIKQRGVEVE